MSHRIGMTTALCTVVATLAACSDAPFLVESNEFASPDGKLVATLEVVDNGLGFGLAALFDEVHVQKAGRAARGHGDGDTSVVFYIESNYGKGKAVSVHWLDNNRLLVEYDSMGTPGKRVDKLAGASVEYRTY